MGFIYLLRAPLKYPANVFKVGMTKYANSPQGRLKAYGQDARIVMTRQCEDARACERKILAEFKEHFEIHHGLEWFSGDLKAGKYLMEIIINEVIDEERNDSRRRKPKRFHSHKRFHRRRQESDVISQSCISEYHTERLESQKRDRAKLEKGFPKKRKLEQTALDGLLLLENGEQQRKNTDNALDACEHLNDDGDGTTALLLAAMLL